MVSIQYLRLDPVNDAIFAAQSSLTDLDAVAQAILTRLKLFQGEWWETFSSGNNSKVDSKVFLQHTHSGVAMGGETSGPVA